MTGTSAAPPLRRAAAVAMLAVGAALVLGLSALHGPAAVRAASPEPSADAGGDTRSAGEGPGLVGAPGLAIGGVILLGLVAAGLTLAYVRFTGADTSAASAAGARRASAALAERASAATGASQPSTSAATPPPLDATGPRTSDPPGSDRGGSG